MRLRTVLLWVVLVVFLLPAMVLTVARVVQPSGSTGIGLVAFSPYALVLYAVALVVGVVGLLARVRPRLLVAALVGVSVVGVEADVDLLVVEEITPALLADMDRAGLADLLPERVGAAGAGGSGTMAFSRLPVSEVTQVPTTFNGWEFVTGGLRVMAVHPTYPVDEDGWAHDQAAIARTVADSDPDLVVGDLNATADHESLQALADSGYRDAGELANDGWQRTWPTQGGFLGFISVPLVQIDHVLLGPRLASLGMHTAAIPGSDHRAVVATVALE